MNTISRLTAVLAVALLFTACKKEKNPVIVPPASDGSTLTLHGLLGSESGTVAGNSVFVDLSNDKQTAVRRNSWVLGFNSGSEFRVRLNNTNGTSAIALIGKTDLNSVSTADFNPKKLEIQVGVFLKDDPTVFSNFDDVFGNLSKNIINNVSAVEAENPVYIIHPAGGSHSTVLDVEQMVKIRILRKGNGYLLHYAKVNEKTFKSIEISKESLYNDSYLNFESGNAIVVQVEPEKAAWDFVWTWSVYYGGTMGTVDIYPYGFSDLVFLNSRNNTWAAAVSGSTIKYADFGEKDLPAISFSQQWDVIGDDWRNTTGSAIGVKKDLYYIIKDSNGNIYKLKFISFHSNDGGKRGEPVIEYKLIKKG